MYYYAMVIRQAGPALDSIKIASTATRALGPDTRHSSCTIWVNFILSLDISAQYRNIELIWVCCTNQSGTAGWVVTTESHCPSWP